MSNRLILGFLIGMTTEYLFRVQFNYFALAVLVLMIVMAIISEFQQYLKKDGYKAGEDLKKGDVVYLKDNKLYKFKVYENLKNRL